MPCLYQLLPQSDLESPPEHCFAAAWAEAWIFGRIWSCVKGAMVVVKVNHDDRKPLKQSWLRSHIMLCSQEISDMMSPPYSWGKNLAMVVPSKPSTASFHFPSPSVYRLVRVNERERVTRKGTHQVVHVCSSAQVSPVIVCPLQIPMILAVGLSSRRIGNVPIGCLQQRRSGTPIPDLLRPVNIGLILGVATQTSC